MENKETFNYTYSAKEQEEVKSIREKYQPKTENKMEQLRRLDASVTQKATVAAITIGVIGALILGMGMSLVMTDIGAVLGIANGVLMPAGIIIGIVGIAVLSAAYPVYNKMVKIRREKIAPEILRLTDELMK